jgi:CIC family chloride channel protein
VKSVLHAPQTLRALVRANELWLVVLAGVVGAIAGVMVFLMTAAAQILHVVLFHIDIDQHLSALSHVEWHRALLVPPLGGLLLGGLTWLAAHRWPRRAVDAIEANALFGGRMSLSDSVLVVVQTIISNGVGASLGLEAGYTQIGSGIASKIGRSFRVRRSDLRLMVGCGAAGAIAAAFNAPICGAFYGFELVIGTYTLASFAPVLVASLISLAVLHLLGHAPFELQLYIPHLRPVDYPSILLLGMFCALIGIAIMFGVTVIEGVFRRLRLPVLLRPLLGGAVVGMLALLTPAVLSSGHGAIGMMISAPFPLYWVALLVLLKSVASAFSIGSGFRGGLFFASLFLGALAGRLFAGAEQLFMPGSAVPLVPAAVVGMSAMATAIVGAPLAMSFLALEATSSLPMTMAVIGAVVVSSLTVRRTFGYSFATWRFHLRGEAIRSAVDIGWMRSLTVGRMMRRQVRTVRAATPLSVFRRDFPLGSTQRVLVVDAQDRYAGIIYVDEAHAQERKGGETVGDLLHHCNDVLLPQMTVKDAITAFEGAESDALVVVDGAESRQVVGLLTEAYALRRYTDELDRSRRELSGE